jgi:hypothetical protein
MRATSKWSLWEESMLAAAPPTQISEAPAVLLDADVLREAANTEKSKAHTGLNDFRGQVPQNFTSLNVNKFTCYRMRGKRRQKRGMN